MVGGLDFAEGGLAVLGELGGSFASILGGLGYHLGLDFVEAVESVVDIRAREWNAACQQYALLVDHGVDFVYLGGVDIDRTRKCIAVVAVGFAVAFGLRLVYRGSSVGDVSIIDTTFSDKGFYFGVFVFELGIQFLKIIAGDGVAHAPRCVVGLDCPFGQATHAYFAITKREVVDAGFERKAADNDTGCDKQRRDCRGKFLAVHNRKIRVW